MRAVTYVEGDNLCISLGLSLIHIRSVPTGSLILSAPDYYYEGRWPTLPSLVSSLTSVVTRPPMLGTTIVACTAPLALVLRPSITCDHEATDHAVALVTNTALNYTVPLHTRGLALRIAIRPILRHLLTGIRILGGYSCDPSPPIAPSPPPSPTPTTPIATPHDDSDLTPCPSPCLPT